MKITFLCGSLEIGRDGVGDYTRQLAGELVRQGHQVALISLNDYFVNAVIFEIQKVGEIELQVLRLPSVMSYKKRMTHAKEWAERLAPDWLSLQYVPFSFDSKGLPINFILNCKKLFFDFRIHLMLHESWVGKKEGNKWKMLLLAYLQKKLFQVLLFSIHPKIIHSSIPFNCDRLKRLGFRARPLPLFSNVRPIKISSFNSSEVLRIVVFSQASNSKALISFLMDLKDDATKSEVDIEVLLIGGNKIVMDKLRNSIEQLAGYENSVKQVGFIQSDAISKIMQTCTLGLTPIPRHMLGKSGTVAAFIAHGLPVAAPYVYPGFHPDNIGFFSSSLKAAIIKRPKLSVINDAREALIDAKDEISLTAVAKRFLLDLGFRYNDA